MEKAIQADACPDPTPLTDLIEEAKAQAETADESVQELGYFQTGAREELLNALSAVETEIEGKVLGLDQIAQYEEKIQEALAAFTGKLIQPETGKAYQIASGSESDYIAGNYVYAPDADVASAALWDFAEDPNLDTRVATFWLVEACEDGVALKNLAKGVYLWNGGKYIVK